MSRTLSLALAAFLVVAGVFLLLSMALYQAAQIGGSASPAALHPLGLAGAYAAHGLLRAWGIAAYLIPVIAIGYAFALWREFDLDHLGRRLTGAVLLIPAACGLAHLLPLWSMSEGRLEKWDQLQLRGLGGALGRLLCGQPEAPFLGGLLVRWLDVAGSAVILLVIATGALLMMDLGLANWMKRVIRSIRSSSEEQRPGSSVFDKRISTAPFVPATPPSPKRKETTSIHGVAEKLHALGQSPPAEPNKGAEDLIDKIRKHRQQLEEAGQVSAAGRASSGARGATPAPAARLDDDRDEDSLVEDEAVEPMAVSNALAAPSAQRIERPKPRAKTERVGGRPDGYVLPPVSLLEVNKVRRDAEHELEKVSIGKAIEAVFADFNIDVAVVAATRGPVVTQYEIKLLDQGMRVNKVEGFEKDLAMKLGTEGIRIVAPLPNKTTIGVEVPNKVKEAVVMRELVDAIDPATNVLPMILGRDAVGKALITDLSKCPHLLVAGSTGMGKSVCMNAMICSILLFRSPDEVKFIMIDPKMVELAGYEDIPHLLAPPITDMTKAHAALEWACQVMDQRYEALKATGCRNIGDYNQLGIDEIRARLEKRRLTPDDLPEAKDHMFYIVVLVDEYADLMMVNKEVEKSIVRLAAKSRACGIHVILTTQRPSADVVTGLIKSNLPSRICFRVVDKNNSRVVLDLSGAENLLGKGDMLFLQPGTSSPVRGQGVWLKDSEISAIVEHAKAQGRPDYNEDVVNVGAVALAGGGSGSSGKAGGEWVADRGFHEAVQAMYRYNKSGADFFRRKMNIGYNKATALVEQLEDLGFVSEQKGTAPRDILKSWDDWIDLLKENGVTWEEGDDIYRNPAAIGEG